LTAVKFFCLPGEDLNFPENIDLSFAAISLYRHLKQLIRRIIQLFNVYNYLGQSCSESQWDSLYAGSDVVA
jgi:hypothetical protein